MKSNGFSFKLAFAAPLVFALSACGDEAEGVVEGEAIEAVPAPEGTSWTETVQTTEEGGYLIGNPDAPLKLIEYGSLTCPACARFAADGFDPLIEDYVSTGKVAFEFRSFIIHGPLDLTLTRLIGCSAPESAIPLSDEIWENLGAIQERAYSNQQAFASINNLPEDQRFVRFGELAGLYDFFAARGISEDQARSCLSDFDTLEQLAETSQSYADNGISQTPTFVLNDRKLDASNWEQLEPILQRAGARPE